MTWRETQTEETGVSRNSNVRDPSARASRVDPELGAAEREVRRVLCELTLTECEKAVASQAWPRLLRPLARLPFVPLARRLGATIASFDAAVGQGSLPTAAGRVLGSLDVVPMVRGNTPFPRSGPLVVVANHPGVYDALALFAAIGREDLRVIAAERDFLRALPQMERHLLFVEDSFGTLQGPTPTEHTSSRGRGLRRALQHLRAGGCLLHFAAGRIEPDPAFAAPDDAVTPWQSGVGALSLACQKLGGEVRLGLVRGVHSPRLERSAVMQALARRGAATLSGLLQVGLPTLLPVFTEVLVSKPLAPLPFNSETATEELRLAARQLLSRYAPSER